MSLRRSDLGVLGNLAEALGIFVDGEPNADWFSKPDVYMRAALANPTQREALLAFVDEALGGADLTVIQGVTWLPIVSLHDIGLTVAVTVNPAPADGLHIGLGLKVATRAPAPVSATTLTIPLFRTRKQGGPPVSQPLLLGSDAGRIAVEVAITLDSGVPTPGQPRLGGISLTFDTPTSAGGPAPAFGMALLGLQMPGAAAPRDVRINAQGANELDDALLDLLLTLLREQANAAAAPLAVRAFGGLLGLRSGDAVPDFPIAALPSQGPAALAAWVHGILGSATARGDWLGYVAQLIGGSVAGDEVHFPLAGGVQLNLRLGVSSAPNGHTLLTPRLGLELGNATARVQAAAELLRIDLATGAAIALPSFGLWAASGTASQPVLNAAAAPPLPAAHADTLRVGFAMDEQRRPLLVLAADNVQLGDHHYAVLDLTSPDAVMDAAGSTVAGLANQLLAGLGTALNTVRQLLGLDPPAGVPAITLAALMANPLQAVAGYWRHLITSPAGITTVLESLRLALGDTSRGLITVQGNGSAATPWRLALAGPLALECVAEAAVLHVHVVLGTEVVNIGQRCTVVSTRIAAQLARLDLADLAAPRAQLLPGLSASLTTRERTAVPARARLDLAPGLSLLADHVGLRLDWTAADGLRAQASAPNPRLRFGTDQAAQTVALAWPELAADGSVNLPPAGWDAMQSLVAHMAGLGGLADTVFGEAVRLLGWQAGGGNQSAGGAGGRTPVLRLADLVSQPQAALAAWLPSLLMSQAGPPALSLLAHVFSGTAATRGRLAGSGHPSDPFRVNVGAGLPQLALWLPPDGPRPGLLGAGMALRGWRPGSPGLDAHALAASLLAEAAVAEDLRLLISGRPVQAGLAALMQRWLGGDGRIVAPVVPPAGVLVRRTGRAYEQLWAQRNLTDSLGRTPTTVVHVDLGAAAWPNAPAGRRLDCSAAGVEAAMISLPALAAGEWFVALGTRADCRGSAAGDGTAEQAQRLGLVLAALSAFSSDIAVVALGGAGHAARLAAHSQVAVTDVLMLGTPLSAISLTAVETQPTADALRLLQRLLPVPRANDPDDADLALGRALVNGLMALADRPDAGADLRLPSAPLPAPRVGLRVTAVFGEMAAERIRQGVTAVVAAGLAERAQRRALSPPSPPQGLHAGLRWAMPETDTGSLAITASAAVSLFSFDAIAGPSAGRLLRVQLRLADRIGWLMATPEMGLRAVTAELELPLDGSAAGRARIVLHDARAFGQSWEALSLGHLGTLGALGALGGAGAPAPTAVAAGAAVLPEARVLLAGAVQRLTADLGGSASLRLRGVLAAIGLIDATGALLANAVDQFVFDAGGLLRQRLAAAPAVLQAAVSSLLGLPAGSAAGIYLAARILRLQGGGATAGRFGWRADLVATPGAINGFVSIGPDTAVTGVGGLQLRLDVNAVSGLAPAPPPPLPAFTAQLNWFHPGGGQDSAPLWPTPQASALARLLAHAAPGLAAQVALEVLRRGDDAARPLVDAALDALGLLYGAGAEAAAPRALRPLAGLLRDPAGWLRGAGSLASQPARIQALLDALRPLMGLSGAAGTPLALFEGVLLGVQGEGSGARVSLSVDPSGWVAPAGSSARFAAGLGASVLLGASGPPSVALDLHLGLPGAAPGRRALHARLGAGGGTALQVFLRPATGSDIGLLPFSGLGALGSAAQAALPFLLDQLAGLPSPVGPLVATLGDALSLRSGPAPVHFDGPRLQAWAADPAGALGAAVPSILSVGLNTLSPLLGNFMPSGLSVSASAGTLTASFRGVALAWTPGTGTAALSATDVVVPGIEHLSFRLAFNPSGLQELSATAGPAAINAGGVVLKPFVTVAAGSAPVGGRRVAVGLAVDSTHRFAARWLLDGSAFALVSSTGSLAAALDSTDPAAVAARIVEAVIDIAAAVAMAQPAVQTLLTEPVGGKDVAFIAQGVLLADVPNPRALLPALFSAAPPVWLARVQRLFTNIAQAGVVFHVDALQIAFVEQSGSIGVQVGLSERFALVSGDVSLWLENDDSWIDPNPPGTGGLFVGLLKSAPVLAFKPSLVVNGLGLRIGKSTGPLLDAGLSIDSVALHLYAATDDTGFHSGGAQITLAGLAVPTGGAGGNNGIAQGVMRDTGPTPPRPAFSPALAIQKHGSSPVAVSLRAGSPPGPWWIAIQRGFGPLYLEQVGFDARMPAGKLERVSLLMDGSVSLFGLTAAVDDLQITYFTADGNFFDAHNWKVDLAGLAVSANMAGVSLAGGLLKQVSHTPQGTEQTEYLGMLLGRFAVYGLTVYGGYGEGVDAANNKFTAFFAIGAVNGPIGGPPAFFLTGIGGGFGINRKLRLPDDMAQFDQYLLIKALDLAAQPGDPMAELRALGSYFPMSRGMFWFAAGLSFNSFALVDGIAVVGVQVGDGLDISLLGLARMALPRPQAAIVSIELALLVRFSSSEGVLWVQGQLTDNSWLLYSDVKLTGGFAYVMWFKGEHAGEFVTTMGGYHPDFHRAGYPVVPRLGLRWSIGDNIVIKAGSYFALTSEALMAGGDFEVSASFGPAWAEVKFGAHGIVFFDPFSYSVMAYARIAAGITIDTWIFGEVTISISLGASIAVQGPEFRGTATFEVGPIELTVEFGGSDRAQRQRLAPDAFIQKYLEMAEDGSGARIHALMVNDGALPAKGDNATPDGSAAKPYVVVVEFAMSFTSAVPAVKVVRTQGGAGAQTTHPPSAALAVAPMLEGSLAPTVVLTWLRENDAGVGEVQDFPFVATPRAFGRFPKGVWGPAGDADNPKVPKADMLEALNELDLQCRATPSAGGPEIAYFQVETNRRLPLPFSRSTAAVAALRSTAQALAGLVAQPANTEAAFSTAKRYLSRTATPTTLATLRGERQAPPRPGTLAEGLETPTLTVVPTIATRPAAKVYDHFIDAPVAVGLMAASTRGLKAVGGARTTVAVSTGLWRVAPPTLAAVTARRSRSIAARLVLVDAVAARDPQRETLIAASQVPPTAIAHQARAFVARAGAPAPQVLVDFNAALSTGLGQAPATGKRRANGTRALTAGASLAPGQTVVLHLPNARADADPEAPRPQLEVQGMPARVVVLGASGRRVADLRVGPKELRPRVEIPRGTAAIVVLGLGQPALASTGQGPGLLAGASAGLMGWHAGQQLPYVGWTSALGAACVVQSNAAGLRRHAERHAAGWVAGAELAAGITTVSTVFADAPRTVVVVLDDPAAGGDTVAERELLLGLDGAQRVLDAAGLPLAPQLLSMDNRSVLAYAVQPERDEQGREKPVSVTIASQNGWSLVAVMGHTQMPPEAALALIAQRGLDAAVQPMLERSAQGAPGAAVSRLLWLGPSRSAQERQAALAQARGQASPPAPQVLRAVQEAGTTKAAGGRRNTPARRR